MSHKMAAMILAFVFLVAGAQGLCPDKCTCDDVNLIVTCIRAGLEVMPNTLNPRLQTIVYKHNNFPMVDVSLRFLAELVKVDLSHNHIVSVTNNAFASQANLKTLHLDSNKIGQISNKTFLGLSRLEVLSLRSNEISELPQNLFMFASQLKRIDLSRNRISVVHDQAFARLENVGVLHLEDNYLNSIPTEAFRHIPSLAELYLSGNPLVSIAANAFLPFKSLTVLDMSSCRIENIDDLGFRNLGPLRRLKLADNNLTDVPTGALRNLPALRFLDIGRNPFDTIRPNALRFLGKLKHLTITGCPRLTEILPNAFSGCMDLESVTISMNRALVRIAGDAFDAMPTLHHLNLADNRLRHLPESLVSWPLLRSLDLSGNPWQCDCDLIFIPHLLKVLRERAQLGYNLTSTSQNPDESYFTDTYPIPGNFVAGNCAGPDNQISVSLHDFHTSCPTGKSFVTATTVFDSRSYDVTDDYNTNLNGVDILRDNNQTAVIISVTVVVVVLSLAIILFICVKCRHQYRDCAKRYRQWRHQTDTSPGVSSMGSNGTKSSSLRRPPQYADHLYYPSPYRQSNSSGSSGAHYSPYSPYYTQQHPHLHHQGSVPLSASDDEYYYVSTSLRGSGDTSAKHIPVTVL